MRTHPAYGRGVGFPFRINPATGGVTITEGLHESVSVALQYLNERWTIREDISYPQNHIAEAIAHILLTKRGEHETLPEFGSRMQEILFEPNEEATRLIIQHFFEEATLRWEKRARFPKDRGLQFRPSGYATDLGILPAEAHVEFITQQVSGNMVAPFATPHEAREIEYRTGEFDDSGHDYESRYYENKIHEVNGIRYNRLIRIKTLPPAIDDQFYTVTHGDTWYLISWKLYGDIRYWWILARAYVQDAAKDGISRHSLDPSEDIDIGTIIRVPAKHRILTELSNIRDGYNG